MHRWTKTSIRDAIRDWRKRTGNWPSVMDWTPSQARKRGRAETVALWRDGDYPSASSVRGVYGTWDAALRAAGKRSSSRPYTHIAAPRTDHWTREAIVTAMCEWARLHDGEPPSYQQWSPAMAKRKGRPDMADEFYASSWPPASSVARTFGGWSAAVAAAGFAARKPGGRDGGP